jgi:predicted phosphodiesterase
MRRVALFSDIHGNLMALDAVLADMDACGVAERYCLGDLVGYGPDPAGAVARVRELGIPAVRGNYDDGVGRRRGECGCYYASEQARTDGAASYAFTDAALNAADHDWLGALPDDIRLDVGETGVRMLLAHGSPRRITEYLLPDRPERQLVRLAEEAGVNLVCVGHVHVPYHRMMSGTDGGAVHYVNAGSVGKPKDGDPRAGWVELVMGTAQEVSAATEEEHVGPVGSGEVWAGVVVHRVDYDLDAVAKAMLAAGLPTSLAEALQRA